VFAAVCFTVTTIVPYSVAAVVVAALNVALVPWVCVTAFRIAGRPADRALVEGLGLAAIGMWLEPVYSTFDYGQVNLVLLALVLLDFRPGSRTRGVPLGIACAIKVTPLIFVGYLVLTRRWRTAAGAVATFVVAQVISIGVTVTNTWDYWTHHLLDLHRVGRLENAVNQTIRGMGVRIEHTRDTGFAVTAAVALVALGGLACAWYAHRRLGDARGLVACAITGLLVSPISWSHHWVWCLPLVAVLWAGGARRAAVVAAVVFASFVVWYLPQDKTSPELHYAAWQVLVSGAYVYVGLVYLAATAVQARRAAAQASHPAPERETVVAPRRRATDAAGDL
jgi:alpha-1,2-mannosyltransferase